MKYRLSMEAKPRLFSSLAAEAGTICHAFFARYAEHCNLAGRPTDLAWGRDELCKLLNSLAGKDILPDVGAICNTFLDSHTFNDGGKAELELSRDNFGGRVDYHCLTGNTLVVTDYKSGWRIPAKSEAEAGTQGLDYLWLLAPLYPEAEMFSMVFDYVRYGRLFHFERTRAEVEAHGAALLLECEAISKCKDFPAQPGSWCNFCDYILACPVFRAAIDNPASQPGIDYPIATPEQAVQAMKEYAMLKAGATMLEKRLKNWVDENGFVESGDQLLGYKPSTKVSWTDTEKLVNTLIAAGIDRTAIWGALSLSNTAVKKLTKKLDKPQRDTIYDGAESETTTRFGFMDLEEEK